MKECFYRRIQQTRFSARYRGQTVKISSKSDQAFSRYAQTSVYQVFARILWRNTFIVKSSKLVSQRGIVAKLWKFHRNRNTRLREKAKQTHTHTHTHTHTLRYYIIVVIITIVVRQYRDYSKPGASALACSQVAMGGSRSSRSTSICRVFQPTHPQTNQIFFIMLALRKAGLLREQATSFI